MGHGDLAAFSILERIDVGETIFLKHSETRRIRLSVSSNGSTWVKPDLALLQRELSAHLSVSSNGSTWVKPGPRAATVRLPKPFSILERIDVGETLGTGRESELQALTFSILERIDVGETPRTRGRAPRGAAFQYPRTDRRG